MAAANADKTVLVEQLRDLFKDVEPLPGEEDFFNNEETLLRFLKAREWDLKEAERQLRGAVEWRREYKPLEVDCKWCHDFPGYHSMRQVGFDELGRPVIYSSFIQAETHKNIPEDSIAHCTYLIENAKRCMKPGVTTWVWVIDCTGVTLPACNPRLGYSCSQVLSNYYPERLGMVICINHSAVFSGVWKAIKVFLHPATADKVRLIRSKKKLVDLCERYFPDEMTKWLLKEIKLNKSRKLSSSQRHFWRPPKNPDEHDPRGCASYIREHIEHEAPHKHPSGHQTHPNIVDWCQGQLRDFELPPKSKSKSKQKDAPSGAVPNGSDNNAARGLDVDCDDEDDNDEEEEDATLETESDFQIPEEFQIPAEALPIN